MRDRMERFVVLPFSVGCISASSVAVAALCDSQKKSSKSHSNTSPPPPPPHQEEIREDEEENMRNVFKFLAVSKPEISSGIHRLFKNFKTFSQFFGEKDEMDELDGSGMEIGMPTNVRHVSHIGWESALTVDSGKAWEDLITPELFMNNGHSRDMMDHTPLLKPSI